jgi:tetratricopeptide (TPR) repeat protein
LVGSGLYVSYTQINQANAHLQNKNAADLVEQKQYSQALFLLQSLREPLQYSESYWRNLGSTWSALKDYVSAVKALNKAKTFTSNPNVYFDAGKCYEQISRCSEAESNYLTAVNIEPYRFTPRYKLQKLYMLEGNRPKAQLMAKCILELKPRIPSKEVQFYKEAAYRLLSSSEINNIIRQNGNNGNYDPRISPLKITKMSTNKYKLMYNLK